MRPAPGLLLATTALVLAGCGSMADAGARGGAALPSPRPQLSHTQAPQFERAAVLGGDDWAPWADPLATAEAAPAPDYIVDATRPPDGRRRFARVQAAVWRAHADAAAAAPRAQRLVIGIAPGDYHEVVHLPAGDVPITLWGLGRQPADVRIHFALHAGASGADYRQRVAGPLAAAAALAGGAAVPAEVATRLARCAARESIGTFCTPVLTVERHGTQLRQLTLQNRHAPTDRQPDQQAVALAVDGADRVHLERVQVLGHQDTLYLDAGAAATAGAATRPARTYVHRSLVAGDVDFIFGSGTAFFEASEIRWVGALRGRDTGFIAAPSTDLRTPHGFVFESCLFSSVPGPGPQRVHLARQWFRGAACSPYGDHAAACRIAATDAMAAAGELTPTALLGVGQMVVQRSRLGPHLAVDEPWAPWQRDRRHRAWRPAQVDTDQVAQNLRAAGHDLRAWGYTAPQPARPLLAEWRNTPCAAATADCVLAPHLHQGLERESQP